MGLASFTPSIDPVLQCRRERCTFLCYCEKPNSCTGLKFQAAQDETLFFSLLKKRVNVNCRLTRLWERAECGLKGELLEKNATPNEQSDQRLDTVFPWCLWLPCLVHRVKDKASIE